MNNSFWKAGHAPTLFAAFLYFDLSFMVWYVLGPLGVQIAGDLQLSTQQRAMMVATPILAGAVLRFLLGLLADRWSPKSAGILDDGQQRRRLLEQLTRYPPARLAIACDPRRSPDRGTLALLGELARCAASTRIWLLQAPPGEALDSDRLGDWHAALERLQLPHGETSPLAWLETGHD